jgi:HlyD family secretion protein
VKRLLVILVIIAAAGGAYEWNRRAASPKDVHWRTVKVERGEVVEGVAASGALEPFLLVQVGTQVSGTVEKLFKDFNSPVRAGETIALLDSSRLVAQVEQDEAALDHAKADLERAEAQLWGAERDLERQKPLAARNLATEGDLDAAVAAERQYRALTAVARAAVSQAVAQLHGDVLNLRHATIKSPIDGVVISRHVDVGQTVAASLQAPTLFMIANDLTKMQVQASVPESDIGKVREAKQAHFGVDAYPGRRFEGVVSQVRLASTSVQSVVTYTVLVDADNPDGLLMPGMTANTVFEIARSAGDALRVPVAATRYKPSPALVEGHPKATRAKGEKTPGLGKVHVVGPGGLLRTIAVRLGVSNGSVVAVEPVERGSLAEGDEVVVGVAVKLEDVGPNPFGPKEGGADAKVAK